MKKHLVYYISLILILFLGFGLASFFPYQKNLEMLFVMLTVFFYVLWGVIHHIVHHSFSIRIMLEYIAIGVLGISLILFVLNSAL